MADIQPTTPEVEEKDPEWERIQAMTPGLGDAPEEEVTPSEEEPKEETPAVEPETPKVEETPVVEETPAEVVETVVTPTEEVTPAPRPEKYIPVQKYTSEKNAWKEEKEKLEKDLAAANAALGQDKEDRIRKFSEENGVPEETVRELLKLEASDSATAHQELDESIIAQLAEGEILRAEKEYDADFTKNAVPELKTLYPEATPEQLAAAKAAIEEIACSAEFLNTPLNKVVLASQKELAPLFKTVVARKGPEGGRPAAQSGVEEFKAEDFKEGKTSFAVISTLPVSKQDEIVNGMDVKTYEAFTRWQQNSAPITINRGGQRVEF